MHIRMQQNLSKFGSHRWNIRFQWASWMKWATWVLYKSYHLQRVHHHECIKEILAKLIWNDWGAAWFILCNSFRETESIHRNHTKCTSLFLRIWYTKLQQIPNHKLLGSSSPQGQSSRDLRRVSKWQLFSTRIRK